MFTLGILPQAFAWHITHLLQELLANTTSVFLPGAQVLSFPDTCSKCPLGTLEVATLEISNHQMHIDEHTCTTSNAV